MHLMSSSKLKALFLLPVLLIIFSFGEGDKEVPKFPLAENSVSATEFEIKDEGIEPILSEKENTFYIAGEVVDPSVEVKCEDDELAVIYNCNSIDSKFNFLDVSSSK